MTHAIIVMNVVFVINVIIAHTVTHALIAAIVSIVPIVKISICLSTMNG